LVVKEVQNLARREVNYIHNVILTPIPPSVERDYNILNERLPVSRALPVALVYRHSEYHASLWR
jgi:hypothetical protein